MTTKQSKTFHFEHSLSQLNTIVEQMEHGDLELEQALKQFEQGIGLIRKCQTELKQAEQKVSLLVEKDGKATLEPFQEQE